MMDYVGESSPPKRSRLRPIEALPGFAQVGIQQLQTPAGKQIEAKLQSCVEAMQNVVGSSVSESILIKAATDNGFDVRKALDAVLSGSAFETPKPPISGKVVGTGKGYRSEFEKDVSFTVRQAPRIKINYRPTCDTTCEWESMTFREFSRLCQDMKCRKNKNKKKPLSAAIQKYQRSDESHLQDLYKLFLPEIYFRISPRDVAEVIALVSLPEKCHINLKSNTTLKQVVYLMEGISESKLESPSFKNELMKALNCMDLLEKEWFTNILSKNMDLLGMNRDCVAKIFAKHGEPCPVPKRFADTRYVKSLAGQCSEFRKTLLAFDTSSYDDKMKSEAAPSNNSKQCDSSEENNPNKVLVLWDLFNELLTETTDVETERVVRSVVIEEQLKAVQDNIKNGADLSFGLSLIVNGYGSSDENDSKSGVSQKKDGVVIDDPPEVAVEHTDILCDREDGCQEVTSKKYHKAALDSEVKKLKKEPNARSKNGSRSRQNRLPPRFAKQRESGHTSFVKSSSIAVPVTTAWDVPVIAAVNSKQTQFHVGDSSKVQDDEVGDGTTSVTVLASELLREAEKLISMKLHPQTIISGWRKATSEATDALTAAARDNSGNPEKFCQDLLNIARTTLSSKILSQHKDFFSRLAVDAVMHLKGSGNLQAIQIIKKLGCSLTDSFLDEGFLLNKKPGVNQPKRVEKARILIANTPMDADKVKIFGSRVRVDSIAKVAEMELAEKEKMKDKIDLILKHNINVFINRQLIYNYPEQLFADAGVMAIEHADFDGIERLALVTGGEIVSTFGNPDKVQIGHCDLIEEVMIGEDKLLKFSGVPLGEACTIVLRGATQQILDEAERSLHDALCVLSQTVKENRTVYGGGCAEMLMANSVARLAQRTAGKEALAMESFVRALHQIPTIIADNAGYDSAQLVSELRAAHAEGKTTFGLNMSEGKVDDMEKLGVTESYIVKRQVLLSAAEMILRVHE